MKCNEKNANCKFKDRYDECEILIDTIFRDASGAKKKCSFYKELKQSIASSKKYKSFN